MGLLTGRRVLVTGLLSNRSIACGIARALRREGAELACSYAGDALRERVQQLATEVGASFVLPCDVAQDGDIAAAFETLRQRWGSLDGLVHSIAYAPQQALQGDYLDALSREAFRVAHDISAYSLAALAKAARPLMQGRQGTIVALTHLGAQRSFPNYNVMGLAKASLEANVRYLAACLGPEGIRVNGISAGPIRTLAAAGIADFCVFLRHVGRTAPLRRNVSIDEVGNVAVFLSSTLSSAMTGEILFADCGFSTTVPLDCAEASPGLKV